MRSVVLSLFIEKSRRRFSILFGETFWFICVTGDYVNTIVGC